MSILRISFCVLAMFASVAHAHHSFAIYDIDNKISRTGVLKKFEFNNPHIEIVLEVDGGKEVWVIESMAPRRWDSFDLPRDVAKVGDKVTLTGWPARNGDDEMALSTITTEAGETVVRDRIRQRSATQADVKGTVKRK